VGTPEPLVVLRDVVAAEGQGGDDATGLGVLPGVVDAAGIAVVRVPVAGRYRVNWQVRRGEQTVVVGGEAPAVLIEDGGGIATHRVELAPAALAAAERRLPR
jgi:hypothetical protein